MDDSNDVPTWECYYTTSNKLELEFRDIIKNYVIENKVKLEECIESYINEKKIYILASCNVKGKPKSSEGIYSKECWVSFFAEKKASNCYILYIADPTSSTNGVITKEQVQQIFIDRFHPQRVDFEWFNDRTSSLSSGLGYFKSSIDSSREDAFVLAPLGSTLESCLSCDNYVIKYGLSEKLSAKPTLVKILCALHRILTYDKTYCLSEKELENLTGILHRRNFRPKGQNENDLQQESIKVLCKIENRVKIAQKCSEDIYKYCCDNKAVHKEILHRSEIQLMHDGNTLEVKACLRLAITDRLEFITAVLHLIPTKEVAYEMLNDLVEYLVSNEAESLGVKEKELMEKANAAKKTRKVSENKSNDYAEVSLGELLENEEQLIDVRKKREYYLHKADIINSLDLNELLLLLGEQSKNRFNCLHILNQETIHMLVENARGEISKGTSLALIRVIASLPEEIKLQVSIKHFLFKASKEASQWIVKLGLDGKLVTEDIDPLCRIMFQILYSNEESNKEIRKKAVHVLKLHKNKLSEDAAMLLEIEVNHQSKEYCVSNILKFVTEGKQIPQHYFYHLLPLNEQSIKVLEQVAENRIQDLPEYILKNLKSLCEHSDDYCMVLRVIRILLKLQYLSWSDPKIIRLLRRPCYTNHMLQLILDYFALKEIPENLLEEIKKLPRTQFVQYFFDVLHRKAIINDIAVRLRNPNVRDEDKKMIIKTIPSMNRACPKILEVLEDVIRCDENLRAEAFQSLIQVLPEHYQINRILEYLDIKSLKKQDMAILKDKGCDLIPLLDDIIKYLYNTNTNHRKISSLLEMTSISELSLKQFCLLLHFAKYSSIKEVRSNIKRFIQRTNYGKKKILDMDHLGFLQRFSLESDPEVKLNRLQHCVENGFTITEDVLLLLIDAMQSKHYMNQERNIENILFSISQHQSIPSNVYHSLLKIINAGNASHLTAEFIAFAANMGKTLLSNQALNAMFNDCENGFMILCGVANYAKERELPGFVLTHIANYLINPNENVETRTLAAAILAHQENKYGYLPQIITMRVQREFFNKLLCIEISEEYQILLSFLLDDDKSFHEKFFVLHGLSSNEAVNKKILRDFHTNDWRKEFFAHSLFLEMIQTKQELHECFLIKEFRDNFNKLHALTVESSSKTRTTEAVYEALLQKQRTFKFSLRDGINVLMMLHSNANALHLVFNSSDSFVQQLKFRWINFSLQVRKIEFTFLQLKELCKYIAYKTVVLDHFFHKLEENSSMHQLTEFFHMLTESQLPLCTREEFLMDGNRLFSARQWKAQLALLLAENMLDQKMKKCKVQTKSKPKQTIMGKVKNYFWATNTPIQQDAKGIKEKVKRMLTHLLLSGWSERSLLELIPDLDTEDKLIALLEALIIIYDYKLTIGTTNKEQETLSSVFKNDSTNWQKKTHEMALYNSFKGTYMKTLPELIKEIYELNKCLELERLNGHKLQCDFEKIMQRYDSCSALIPKACINLWQEEDLKFWVESFKKAPNKVDLFEKIAVVKRAVEIACKFKLRDIQLLTVLILLQANEESGCLAQVNTGEGKTIIIAMIAAVHKLNGHTVDVVTSSPELARPQSQEMQHFFSLLKLTVAHNTENNEKMCYKADIVYGAAGNFQGDILRDEFNQVSIRCGRCCDIAIVDEVDSMLIDNRNYKVMLSSPMPAMNHLEPILAAIWVQIDAVVSTLEEKNGLLFYKNGNELLQIEITKEEFITMCTKAHIKKIIRAEKVSPEEERDYPMVHVPKHLFRLVHEVQLDTWINCAIYAKYSCEENKNYIIKDNKIVPVDASNTGVVQQNMNWNDGLHQFLQIKHGIRITPESLCTNFISNVAYFRRYKKLYGLTGTLGSTNAINLLKKAYKVNHVYIPPFKKEQHLELTPIIVPHEREYYESIIINSLSKLNNNRAVLIITKYIAEAKKLHRIFIDDFGYDRLKVKTYQTETETSVIKENLKPREVIIATNIAGRGTDIKVVREIEVHGGLHVCVTFLPSNLRTERQNVGRTSRMGQKGTSQFIILGEHKSIEEIRNKRDEKEEIDLKNAEQEIERVCVHDEVFKSFCELLICVQNKEDSNDDINMKALEERFALWFKHQHGFFKKGEITRIIQSFKSFCDEIKRAAKCGELIANPYFHVQMGNRFLESKQYDEAIQQYTRAIDMDPDFGDNAYYNRGYTKVAKFGQDVANHEKELHTAVEDFRKAKHIIERYEQELHFIQLTHKAVSEQIIVKSKIYAIQKSAIDKAIGTGNDLKNEMEAKGESPKELENSQDPNQGIIVQAIQKKWNLNITLEKLQKIFKGSESNIALYEAEIEESENNGCIGSFTLQMVQPSIKWWECIGLAIIGGVQIIGGIVLHCLKLFSHLANVLLAEGIKDIKKVIDHIVTRRPIDWCSWGIRKVTSFVASVVVAGVSTTRNVVSGLCNALPGASEYVISGAKEMLEKVFGKPTEAQTGQLNTVLDVVIESGLRRSLIPELQHAIFTNIIKPLEDLLTDECQEEFVRKIIEGIMGHEKVKRYAREIAFEIGNKKKFSVANANLSKDIRDLRSVPEFINYFIRFLATELQCQEVEIKKSNKQLSEEIATQVSGCVASLVERDILTAYSINPIEIKMIGAEVLTKHTGVDECTNPQKAERWCSEASEYLRESSVQELLICLSDEAQIPIRIVDDKGKWVHTIGKDKEGTAFEIPCNKLTFSKNPENGITANSECLFCAIAEHSGTSAEKLHLVALQSKSRSKENLMMTLYKKELQKISRKGKEWEEESLIKSSYLCREQYNQIAYRALTDSKLTLKPSQRGCQKVNVIGKTLHWHPDFMSYFKHTKNGEKQITVASIHEVFLNCKEKASVLQIRPKEAGKSNFGNL